MLKLTLKFHIVIAKIDYSVFLNFNVNSVFVLIPRDRWFYGHFKLHN